MGGKQVIKEVHLDDISSRNVYLKLKKPFVENTLNIIRKSNTVLPKQVNDQLYRIRQGHKTSLSFVKYISLNLDIPMEEIEQNIELITSAKFTDVGIHKPKFPINFATKDGARLIAAIMGDGELNNQLNVRYNNQDEYLIELVLRSTKKVFGEVDHKIYPREDRTYQLHFPKIAGIIVALLGIKPGHKSETNYGIPGSVFNLDEESKATFIRQFFNDEGNVRLKDRRLQVKQTRVINVSKAEARENISKYAPKALIDLQKLLLDFGIDSKISFGAHRVDRADWELSIYRIENLTAFQKAIDFDVEYKKELLDKAIKSYKFPSSARNGRLDYALECCRKTQKKYGFVTKELLAKTANRSLKVATYYLVDLKKKGHVVCSEKPKKDGRMLAHKYVVKA